jgi:DNA-binding transcriptional LysR family regulator
VIEARDLPLLPVFAAVVRHGSFTAAARELGLAKSVVSQHLRTLEERCGVRLIERTTRHLRVTQVGEQVLEAATSVIDAVHTIEQVLDAHTGSPTGTLRVTAPHDLGASIVTPIAARLASEYPALRLDLVFDDAQRDLVAERFDLALRLGPLRDSGWVVRRLGVEPEVIVGSPALPMAVLAAARPLALCDAPWLAHALLELRKVWTFRNDDGASEEISVTPRAVVNAADAIRSLVLAGAGLAVLPLHMVAADIAAGRLKRVCSGWFRRKISLQALLPTRHIPPRARLFLAAASTILRDTGFGEEVKSI